MRRVSNMNFVALSNFQWWVYVKKLREFFLPLYRVMSIQLINHRCSKIYSCFYENQKKTKGT